MLEDKEFWDDLMQGSGGSQAEQGRAVTAPAFIPGYRTSEKSTTTDPPRARDLDIEAILADMWRETQESAQAPVSAPPMPSADEAAAAEPTADTPHSGDPPADEPDEKRIMREMLSTVRELTEEVKQLRSQLEARPRDAAQDPTERPPALAADVDEGIPETKPDAQGDQKKPAKNKAISIISSVLFYVVIVAMILGAFLMRSTGKGEPFMIAGYSAANVLTGSMADVYPQGSLIITRQVDAKELQIGDDITFMVSEDSSITHRIIGITENYQGTGARAFQTQGTKNANPDKEMVAAANVVGKVIFHSKALGDFANFVKENWPILIFVLVVIIALITVLKWNAKKSDEEDGEQKEKPEEKTRDRKQKKRRKHSERRSESNGDE